MANLPPSPFSYSGEPSGSLDEAAVASVVAPSDAAAVDIPDLGTDDICEIFAGARKLEDSEPRFVLDVERFMNDIDEPPLFLRQAV